ncbi:leucine zipper transcription factor-like protein 1 [Lytechinus pictus]|uniref:leucine zipper transcription factor-like protein 1 n=1 Tax=Lytechinus pictus TaxID=7653 RepID=UPI00240DABE9|nr:leucine zipper transcription factor-like protein 1 [Lytechinus pictus]
MAGELGLNDHHYTTIVNFMRFASYKRTQNLRSVERCFEDLKDSRLIEDTFTLDEVRDMLDGLEAVVHSEMELELINTSHTNVLLLRQLFQQAEKWHLKLQADISELENRELIEMIAKFEESHFSGSSSSSKPTFELKRLDPMEAGGVQLLQNEIERLNEENDKLKERLKQVESQATGALQDRSKLESDLRRTQDELGSERNKTPIVSADTGDMEGKMKALKSQMEQNMKLTSDRADSLEGDLISSKHRLLEIQEQLEMKEKELEKKFSQTGAYKNLKSMLSKKNDQIKELRGRLKKFEGDD